MSRNQAPASDSICPGFHISACDRHEAWFAGTPVSMIALMAAFLGWASCFPGVTAQEIATASADELKRQVVTPDVVVPYSPDQPALRTDRIFIRYDDFLKLYQQANPDELKASVANPVGSSVVASFFKTGGLTSVDGSKQVLSLDGRFVVWSDSGQTVGVPLPMGPVAVRSVQVDGKEGSVQPLLVGVASGEIQNFAAQQIPDQRQQLMLNNAAIPTIDGPAYAVQITGRGFHVVDIKFDIPALIEGELGRADLPLRSAAAGTLEWTLPADGLDAKINGRTNVYRRDGRNVIVPIALMSTVRLQWLPTVQKAAGDVVFHSTIASALAVHDSGIVLKTTASIAVRQGEISELEVTIPEGYSVQSVTGDDIAGWTAQSTDATRSVKLQLRRSVSDATKLTMQLYAPAASVEALASLVVPISAVRGASRDVGTVILKTGSQFQVRSDSLSAVTQINPNEAPNPDGDELPGRPMLAWRYTRQPASVTVKVTPTADEMVVNAIHAVRLEEQRQLWSSRMTVQISGAPRSRIDLAVPKTFLALDVSATGIKDWYFSDAADGDNANPDLRLLSIQLTDARSGQLQIAVQGQMNRDADRSLLNLQAPTAMNATKTTSELAVWLDAASESAGLESGVGNDGDWSVKSNGSINAGYREIIPIAPSLAFQSIVIRPRPLTIRLRQAISTLIGESVTVTNVTETALEVTLALNWQIARAAADQFAVELPSSAAAVMLFDVPGQRRVTREDLGNGMTRVTFQLQQPMTDRLFVLGTASLPLPADRVIRVDAPKIVVPPNAPSSLSGQGHFWVLVNQSSGLLQPAALQPEDKMDPEQITTQIPPQLLQQAVAVVKLRPETVAWNLVFPAQHEVAPAVVTLATHTTVISDDGSWRSRHQLQVTNESRQFLPVQLPVGSRLLYCLVEGKPSRIVIRGEGERQTHLIPIPQSGRVASTFEIEFALAGRFDDSAATIRKEWKSHRLLIPVPRFPEFRDDPDYGISVSRNRWSVYVPDSWRATLVDDPAATNVVKAESRELDDASLLSQVEQAASLLKSAKSAKGSYLRSRVLEEVQSAKENLSRSSGHEYGVEQQRDELLSKLSELNESILSEGREQSSAPAVMGNGYLFEQEQKLNYENGQNSAQFWSFNRMSSGSAGTGISNADGRSRLGREPAPETWFRFGVVLKDEEAERLREADKSETAKDQLLNKNSGRKQIDRKEQESNGRAAAEKADVDRTKDLDMAERQAGESKAEEGKSSGRSQLLQRRGSASEEARAMKSLDDLPALEFRKPMSAPVQLQLADEMPADDTSGPGFSEQQQQQSAPAKRTATPTGLLSLKFDIPTDGERIDFLRVGGNPELSLDVRSSESVNKGTGLIWLAISALSILFLLGPGRRGQMLVFAFRLFLIFAVAGFAVWLFTTTDLRYAGLLICITGALGVAAAVVMMNLRRKV